MTKILIKKIIGDLKRDDGFSVMAIVVLMLIMTIMGGVFTSVMSTWKVSSAMTVNSERALQLANTAAAFALQEASSKFYSKDTNSNPDFNFGTRLNPYIAYNDGNGGTGDYWFELPGVNDDGITLGTVNDDDDNINDDGDDNNLANDLDGDGISDRYTIIATGRVNMVGGATIATKQIRVLVDIIPTPATTLVPGVHLAGAVQGNGSAGYDMYKYGNFP
ncbi:MAG: hypothetical protein ACYSWS_05075 [Planctomycetota bacterium]|jgi:hypothetical protein